MPLPTPPRFPKDHPLHPDRIQQLPVTVRGMAKRAMNHSVNYSWMLRDAVRGLQAKFQSSTTICILPALYANLDPVGIPNIDMDDGALITDAMQCAITATQGLYLLQNPHPSIPVRAIMDIWPRYWAWIDFLQIYVRITSAKQRSHPGLSITGLNEFEVGSNAVLFMASFSDKNVCNLFGATPGVRVLIARNWFLLVHPESPGAPETTVSLEQVFQGLDQVFGCVRRASLNASQPADLEEFAEGAGGTIDDLASLVIQSIAFLVPARTSSIDEDSLKFVDAILSFVLLAAVNADDPPTDLRTALYETEFVELVTRVLYHIAQSTLSGANHTVVTCSFVLGRSFGHVHSVKTALKAGLFHVLPLCALPEERIEDMVNGVLRTLGEYGVVRSMEGALPSTEDIVGSLFETSQIWSDFMDLVQKRISIRRALSDSMACDNMTCAATSSKLSVFKRCICNNHYCSKACQKADWRAGHRTVCHFLTSAFGRRAAAFFRAIVHHDYELLKAGTIYPEQVHFMSQFPNDSFFTVFDYSDTRRLVPQIEVDSVERLESEIREAWFDLISQMRSDEGPMELHVMKDDLGTLLLPLRTNSSVVYDGMRSIAASLPPAITTKVDSPALLAAVQEVLDGAKGHFRAVH
ncbi:hypothetical protein C8R43DRAFT_1039126 [Mycena crocata]|nr:hypothetical protein C8R43DRAFT_1039126 [Mycena crocata]